MLKTEKSKKIVSSVATIGILLIPIVMAFNTISAFGQAAKVANFSIRYNLDSTTLTYCNVTGQSNSPFGAPRPGKAAIKTTGSSTTVAAVTALSAPFADLGVNDIIYTTIPPAATLARVIVAKASSDSVTVDTAINLGTSVNFTWMKTSCGTTDDDGWIPTQGFAAKLVGFQLEQISGVGGGIDVRWECRSGAKDPLPVPIFPGSDPAAKCYPGTTASAFCNFTTATAAAGRFYLAIPTEIPCNQVRVGMKINTSDAAEPTEGDKERITTTLDLEGHAQP